MLGDLKRNIYKYLLNRGLLRTKIVVLMDGGICSQMHQYLLGNLYRKRGFSVCYDLTFYKEWGLDINNEFVRNFDILKAFPYLEFEEASKLEVDVYRREYFYGGNDGDIRTNDMSFLSLVPPIYLGGYYHFPSKQWLETFQSLYRMVDGVLDKVNQIKCLEIDKCVDSVGVHVRRGDLKEEVSSYGAPTSFDYFINATAFFKKKLYRPYFYFFSDEPEWVKMDLLPRLSVKDCAEVVDINGSDKGYMDLYLLAHCKHQITTKGTLGKFGALLADNPDKYVVLYNDETQQYWKMLLQNPVFI